MNGRQRTNPNVGFIRLANSALFATFLTERGINPAQAYKSFGFGADAHTNDQLFVHADVFYALTNHMAELAKDRYLGIRVGEHFAFAEWPPFATAVSSAVTLSDFLVRYIQMVPSQVNSVSHSLLIEAERATYRVDRAHMPGVAPIQVTGFGCAQYIRLLQSVTGKNWDPTKVTFESKHITAIPTDYEGISAKYSNDPGLKLSFPAEWLFSKLQLDLEIAEGRSKDQPQEVSLVTALRSAISDHLHESDLSTPAVAGMMGLEADGLTKALKKHKTTVRKEVKKLKIDRAKEELTNTSRSISDIGASLGYENNAHFTRFFRSQAGMSPMQFRTSSM